MDDFGTGYSSLSYLRNIRFDRIKIDRDFISAARQGEQGRGDHPARSSQLGEALGMTTVAEGIETEADLDMLREGRLRGRARAISSAGRSHSTRF